MHIHTRSFPMTVNQVYIQIAIPERDLGIILTYYTISIEINAL